MIRKKLSSAKIGLGASSFKLTALFKQNHVASQVALRYEQAQELAPKEQNEIDFLHRNYERYIRRYPTLMINM